MSQASNLDKDLLGPVLTTDHGRLRTDNINREHCSIDIPPELTQQLNAHAYKDGISTSHILLAAFQILLSRYTQEKTIDVGVQKKLSNIQNTDLSCRLSSYTTNSLEVDESLSFRKTATSIKIVNNDLTPSHSIEFAPLDVVSNETTQCDIRLRLESSLNAIIVHFDYNNNLFNKSSIERLSNHYKTLLQSITDEYEGLVEKLSLVDSAERAKLLKFGNAGKCFHQKQNLHQRFEDVVERNPDDIALRFYEKSITYIEVNKRCNKIANKLISGGLNVGERVINLLENSPLQIEAMFGTLKSGGVFICLDLEQPSIRLKLISTEAQASFVITQTSAISIHTDLIQYLHDSKVPVLIVDADDEFIHSYSNAHTGAIVYGAEQLLASESTNPNLTIDTGSHAYIAYTSGSTGRPKGILQTHGAFCQFIEWQAKEIGIRKHQRFMQWASIGYDAAYCEIFGSLCFGATLIMATASDRHDPAQLSGILISERITILQVVPSFARELAKTLKTLPSSRSGVMGGKSDASWESTDSLDSSAAADDLRVLMLAGERLTIDVVKTWNALRPAATIYNLYGPSESVLATFNRLDHSDDGNRSIGIGNAIDGRQIVLLDNEQRLSPIGIVGELYIVSAYLTEGYLNQAEETELRFIQNPLHSDFQDKTFRTGDSARWLEDGTLEFYGRNDSLVKLNGMRVDLGDIESALRTAPNVNDCVVMVHQSIKRDKLTAKSYEARSQQDAHTGKQVLVGYFSPDNPQVDDAISIRSYLDKRLPKHMVPAQLVRLEQLPLNANGKVDKRALPEPGNARPALAQKYVKPKSGLEFIITDLWAEFLDIEEVGADDNFFELGGDSLLAMQVLNRISELGGKRLLHRHLIEHNTASSLARFLESENSDLKPLRTIQKASLREKYPLAVAQQGLWYLWNLDPDSPFYNALGCLHLEGNVNLPILMKAWESMIERHVVVRSRFVKDNGEAFQIFDETRCKVELPLIDLTHLPHDERQPQVAAAAKASAQKAFNLEMDSLLFANLYKTDEHRYELVFTYHEIILDLWGFAVMIRDLFAFYEDYIAQKQSSLPAIEFDFRDYTVWESEHIKPELLTSQKQYWQDELEGELPILELPLDRPRPRKPMYAGAAKSIMLDETLSEQLRDLSQKSGTTLFTTLLTAFKLLLRTYSGQDDLIVGTPMANRGHKSIEDLVGWFLNMLPIRTRFTADMNFAELLNSVHGSVTGAISNSDYPFSWMLSDADVQRDASVSPVFQVMFNWQNLPHASLDSGSLEISSSELDSGYKKYDLALYAQEHVGRIYLHMSYLTDIFDHETIERMVNNLVVILQSVVDNPAAQLGELNTLSVAENELLDSFKQAPTDFGEVNCIQDEFSKCVSNYRNRTALVFGNDSLSYAELNSRVNTIAAALTNCGVCKGDNVAICANRSFDTVASILAVMKIGGVYVSLDSSYPVLRLNSILQDTQPKAIVLNESLDNFSDFSQPRVVLDKDLTQESNGENRLSQAEIQVENAKTDITSLDPMTIVYTSSSSGTTKGVLIDQSSVLNRIHWMWNKFPFTDGDVALLHKSTSLVASTWELFGALLKGVPTVILSRDEALDPVLFWDVSASNHVSHVLASPPVIEGMLEQAQLQRKPWNSLRFATTSAEPILPEMVERWHKTFSTTPLLNLYGSTECSSNATVYDTKHLPNDAVRVPIGRPLDNVSIEVVNNRKQRLPIGAVGEMAISGACLARGYVNLPELNAKNFFEGPPRTYLTGDLVRYSKDGALELVGRLDRQVNVRGFRVNLDDVESTLAMRESVLRSAVILQSAGTANCQLWAYVVLQDQREDSHIDLRNFLRDRLPEYMVPSRIILLVSLPQTRTGKLDYKSLPVPDLDQDLTNVEHLEPQDDLELRVVKVCEDILNVPRVGMNDDFFDLGGHSLLAVQLLGLLEKEFKKVIPLGNFFQDPTMQYLANFLKEQGQSDSGSAIVPLRRQGTRPPLFLICGIHIYRDVAECLNNEQPVYTIFIADEIENMASSRRAVRDEELPSVEKQAAQYVKLIRDQQATGPYYLGGVSFGGLLAYEIAQQLHNSGEQVDLVAAFDSSLRGTDTRHPLRVWLSNIKQQTLARLRGEPDADAMSKTNKLVALRRRMFSVTGLRYKAKPANFRFALFRAMDRPAREIDPLIGWKDLVKSEIEVFDVPGTHVSCLSPPHASVLAEKLESLLIESQSSDDC